MSKLLEDLPGRLDRLADGLTRTAVAPEPERLRARGRRWRRRRRAAGAGLVAALLAGAIFGVGRLSDLRPAPTGRPPTVTTTGSWPLPTMRFAARAPAGGQADAAALDAAARMLGTRLAAAGFTSSTVQVDDGGLLVTVAAVPGREQLVEELVERLAAPGQLQLRPVLDAADPTDPRAPFAAVRCTASPPPARPQDRVVLCARPPGADQAAAATLKLLVGPAKVGNAQVATTNVSQTENPEAVGDSPDRAWNVDAELTTQGARAYQQLTAAAACQPGETTYRRYIATVLDGIVLEHLPISTDVGCRVGITGGRFYIGDLTEVQARAVAAILSTDPLPVRLQRQLQTP